MKVQVLGTRGEITVSAPYHSKHSGVLIEDTLLLDCGEKSFLTYRPEAILITHLHPDHAFFVRTGEQSLLTGPTYAPEPYPSLIVTTPETPWAIGDYTIVSIPTIHSVKVASTSYLIEYKKKRILYTGDMIWIEKRYHHWLSSLDLVITEASFMVDGGFVRRDKTSGQIFGHTGVPNLISLFNECAHRLLFVHFGSWFYRDMKAARKEFKQLARENNKEIIVGYDGLELTL